MTATDHVPTVHANAKDIDLRGSAHVVCLCGYATAEYPRLKDAWAEFHEHYDDVSDIKPLTKSKGRSVKYGLQDERLFDHD